ncbi:MAG: MgtC/SapB family protein [Planctomycetota bacterium]
MRLFEFDWSQTFEHAVTLLVACVIALPVGWDREQAGRTPGLRTFPLVALSSCAYVLVGRVAFGSDPEAASRMLQGLMTGIGFIGGGAILKSSNRVHGTATAASVWTTGAIGASVAHNHLEIALILSLLTFTALRWLQVDGTERPDGELGS